MELAESTVVITGAGGDIGRATARRFAEDGANIVALDVDVESGEETASLCKESGAGATFHELDVSDVAAFTDTLDAVVAEHGSLDVLVNNAGVGQSRTRIQDTPIAERDRLLSVNVEGVWNGCYSALPHMTDRGAGAIVNVSSLAGIVGAPGIATYSLTKGAVLNFTRAVAAEVGPTGVRANAVCPGFVDTSMVDDYFETFEDSETARAETIRQYPLRRLAQPEDVANAIAFLASDEAAFVTGHGLAVDGGFSCY